jgi:hypothetical protein
VTDMTRRVSGLGVRPEERCVSCAAHRAEKALMKIHTVQSILLAAIITGMGMVVGIAWLARP